LKTVVTVAAVLACACSLDAQITATLDPLPDGSTAIRIRNDAAVSLTAYVIRTSRSGHAPVVVSVDSAIDTTVRPLLPNQERMITEGRILLPTGTFAIYEEPIVTAGIFADGTTIGDASLLERLMLRRCNMLQAVELALETLSDAGTRNVPRGQLIEQFKRMADSARRCRSEVARLRAGHRPPLKLYMQFSRIQLSRRHKLRGTSSALPSGADSAPVRLIQSTSILGR